MNINRSFIMMRRFNCIFFLVFLFLTANTYADITQLHEKELIFGNAGGFQAKTSIGDSDDVGGYTNPNAVGAGIQLLPIEGRTSYYTKGLNIQGTLIEVMPDDWSNPDNTSPVITSDNFYLWPGDCSSWVHTACSSSAQWIFDLSKSYLGDLGQPTENDVFKLKYNWFDDKHVLAGHNFVPTFNLYIGNTSSMMIGLSESKMNAFGITGPFDVSGTNEYHLGPQPIHFQSNEANLYIGRTFWNDTDWNEKNPIVTFIPEYVTDSGGSYIEDKAVMIVNGSIPATELTVNGDLNVNGALVVSDFGINEYDELTSDDSNHGEILYKDQDEEIVLASTEFDVRYVTHNIMLLAGSSSSQVPNYSNEINGSSATHHLMLSELYIRIYRKGDGGFELVDYDPDTGTWFPVDSYITVVDRMTSTSSGNRTTAYVHKLTANEYDGALWSDSSNQVTFFAAKFPGSEAGVTYKAESVLVWRFQSGSNGTGSQHRYVPVVGKVVVMGVPGSTLEDHFEGEPDAAIVDTVSANEALGVTFDATFLADNVLSLADYKDEDGIQEVQTGFVAQDTGNKKVLSLVSGGQGGLGVLKANNITAYEYFDKTLLRVLPSSGDLNLLELRNEDKAMVFQVIDQEKYTTLGAESYASSIFTDTFDLYEPTYSDIEAYYKVGEVISPNFYSYAEVSHNIQVVESVGTDLTGTLEIGMGNTSVPFGGDPDDYVNFGSSDYVVVGKSNQIQITADGAVQLNGNNSAGFMLDLGDGDVLVEGEVLGRLTKMFYSRCLGPSSQITDETSESYVTVNDILINESRELERVYLEERANLMQGDGVTPIDYTTDNGYSGPYYFQARNHNYCLVNGSNDAGYSYGYGLKRTVQNLDLMQVDDTADIRWQFRVIATVSGTASDQGQTVRVSATADGETQYGDKVYASGQFNHNTKFTWQMIEEFKNCDDSGVCTGYEVGDDPTGDVVVFNLLANEGHGVWDYDDDGVFTPCAYENAPPVSASLSGSDGGKNCFASASPSSVVPDNAWTWRSAGGTYPNCYDVDKGYVVDCDPLDYTSLNTTSAESYDMTGFSASILIFATPFPTGD